MAPLKSIDKDRLIDADKIFSADVVEVSPYSSTVNLAKKKVRNELKRKK
jgi:arginase family enzyme